MRQTRSAAASKRDRNNDAGRRGGENEKQKGTASASKAKAEALVNGDPGDAADDERFSRDDEADVAPDSDDDASVEANDEIPMAKSSDASSSEEGSESSSDEDEEAPVSKAEIRHAVALASEAAAKTFGWKDAATTAANRTNRLSRVIPGYTAPMRLDSRSLEDPGGGGGSSLAVLRARAERTDPSTARCFAAATASAMSRRDDDGPASAGQGFIDKAPGEKIRSNSKAASSSFASTFKVGRRRQADPTAGSGWFRMVPTPMTDELKTDLALIRNRNYLDPKKFYKSADRTDGKVLQLGTVIEGSAEFYSSRLTRNERRSNLTEEIMADPASADYAKRRFRSMQQEKEQKRKRWKPRKKGRKGY